MSPRALLPNLVADRRGGISIIGALSLTGVAGMAGLAMETSHGYAVKVDNQRIADAAALAGGLSLVADFANDAKATASANAVAKANGIAAADMNAQITTPEGKKLVTVTVDTDVPLSLTRVITDALSFNVVARGKALVTPGASSSTTTTPANANACFLALDSNAATTYGITVTGSASITGTTGASGCDVQAVRGISTNGSANIQARNIQANANILIDGSAYCRGTEVAAGGTVTKPGWNNSAIVTNPTANNIFPGKSTQMSDPLASGTVQTALARVTNTANYPIPPVPATLASPATNSSTTDWSFTNNTGTGTGIVAAWRSGNIWTIPKGVYNLRNVSIGGSTATLRFAPGSTVVISGSMVANGSTAIDIQSDINCPTLGTNCNSFDVAGTLTVEGGGAASSFGHGSYRFNTAVFNRPTNFGQGEVRVTGQATFGPYAHSWGAGAHSFGRLYLSGGGATTFGAGNLHVVQDLYVDGGTTFTTGAGVKTIGTDAVGRGMFVGGSSRATMSSGNATITGSVEIAGSAQASFGGGNFWIGSRNINNSTRCTTTTYDANCRAINVDGSSTLSFGDGAFVTTGGITTAGSSTIAFGAAANHFIRGTMLMNGAATFGSGAYTVYGSFTKSAHLAATGSNLSFFLSGPIELSGSAGSTFAAPTATSASSDALADILFASLTTANSAYTGSSQNTYTGAVYVPNSNFTISGSGRIVSSGCFALIAKTIAVTGSGAGASRCAGIAAAGQTRTETATTPTVALIR